MMSTSGRWTTVLVVLALAAGAYGQSGTGGTKPIAIDTVPNVTDVIALMNKATSDGVAGREWSTPIRLAVLFTALALLPSLVAMMTSFTRIVIVLAFLRRALGTQTIPPTIAVIGLAIFLTLYTMLPTLERLNGQAIQPYLANQMDFGTTIKESCDVLKDFMLRQTRRSDLALFVQMARIRPPERPSDLGLHIIVPAFVISEFRTGFEIGCLLFIPFLVIDIVVASVLLSAGMMMLPPAMISLPFKLILFILVDGWGMLAKSLSLGFK